MGIQQLPHPRMAARAHDASSALTMAGRLGYVARGVVHIVLGVLAAQAAFGAGGATTDSAGALARIHEGPFGRVALTLIAIGLFGYLLWRIVSATTDAERDGNEPSGIASRLWQVARGLLYGALGWQAVQLLRAGGSGDASASGGSAGGSGAEDWTARFLALPFGPWLVGLAGLGVIAYAGYQFYRAASPARVTKHLDLSDAGATQRTWITRAGRIGIAARGVVLALIGVFLVRAALQSDASEAGGIAESLAAIAATGYGTALLALVALGLVAYGLYQIATARYRYMRAS